MNTCTGCTTTEIPAGLARCPPCARELAGHPDEPFAERRRMARQTFPYLRRDRRR
jgi:hypothetical protein